MKIHVLALAGGLFLAACGTTAEDGGVQTEGVTALEQQDGMGQGQRIPIDSGPLAGSEMTDGLYTDGTGTQQDLVVNVGDRVFYGYDRHDLSAEAREVLEREATWLRQYPNVRVVLNGHTDERGTREYNLALGEHRAVSARNYLVALGVEASRIRTVSFGKERPAVLGANPQAWAKNRRAVSVVE